MRRRIFNILAAMSLVLCLAAAVLWGITLLYAPIELCQIHGLGQRKATLSVKAERGFLKAQLSRELPMGPGGLRSLRAGVTRHFAGFNYMDVNGLITRPDMYWDFIIIQLALAWVLLLFAVLPAGWLFLKRREIRLHCPRHLCKKCSYDLRATPDANGPLLERCPECGTEVEAKQASAL